MLQPSPRLHSFSSALMFGVTLDRNQYGIRPKFTAQLGYSLITMIAAVEAAVSAVLLSLSFLFCPCNLDYTFSSVDWFYSSSFVVLWSFSFLFLNPFVDVLVPDEQSARDIFSSINLSRISQLVLF